jgi:YidC/Oxa1 family membrane protein insertase
MDSQRLILLMIFGFSLFMLWEAWQRQAAPVRPSGDVVAPPQAASSVGGPSPATVPSPSPAPAHLTEAPVPTVPEAMAPEPKPAIDGAAKTIVRTDLFAAEVAAQGGDIVRLELVQHKATGDKTKNFLLLDSGEQHVYLGQSGLIGEGLPNHKSVFRLPTDRLELSPGKDVLQLRMEAPQADGVKVDKVLTFRRGSYVIDVAYEITNDRSDPLTAHAYFQTARDGKPPAAETKMLTTFTGPAVYTDAEKFRKINFEDLDREKAKFPARADNGWIGMVQHYFVSAWIPRGNTEREFYSRAIGNGLYSAGVIVPVDQIAPGKTGRIEVPFYAGPQEQDKLAALAPGLDLVVDYGWLTVIAAPIFWALQWLHRLVNNWGWAIILLTVLIKLAFFPLSAASYKSMARMRVVTPKLMKLKEIYGNDRARMNQEMMELYKKEKINPLGGCLPILVQIPVFIALYWVLLGSVEMRDAPWILWIEDLSTKDPYFVLPLIMGATMFIQTKLNPTPPDPIQAKVMLAMPVVFTFMFLFFPAGLVLYWTVNNVLSIAQQWQITRMIERGGKVKPAG